MLARARLALILPSLSLFAFTGKIDIKVYTHSVEDSGNIEGFSEALWNRVKPKKSSRRRCCVFAAYRRRHWEEFPRALIFMSRPSVTVLHFYWLSHGGVSYVNSHALLAQDAYSILWTPPCDIVVASAVTLACVSRKYFEFLYSNFGKPWRQCSESQPQNEMLQRFLHSCGDSSHKPNIKHKSCVKLYIDPDIIWLCYVVGERCFFRCMPSTQWPFG